MRESEGGGCKKEAAWTGGESDWGEMDRGEVYPGVCGSCGTNRARPCETCDSGGRVATDWVVGQAVESMMHVETVKSFNAEGLELARYAALIDDYRGKQVSPPVPPHPYLLRLLTPASPTDHLFCACAGPFSPLLVARCYAGRVEFGRRQTHAPPFAAPFPMREPCNFPLHIGAGHRSSVRCLPAAPQVSRPAGWGFRMPEGGA